jgi:hypothetical protein
VSPLVETLKEENDTLILAPGVAGYNVIILFTLGE